MGFDSVVVVVIIIMSSITATRGGGFRCDGLNTCPSLVGYRVTMQNTTLGGIQKMFNVSDMRDMLAANGFPESTPRDHTVEMYEIIRIPLECECYKNESGFVLSRSKKPSLVYKVKEAHKYLSDLEGYVSWGLVGESEIQNANPDVNISKARVGEEVVIPMPCGCAWVGGKRVVHFGIALQENRNNLDYIAQQYGVTPDSILDANGNDVIAQLQTLDGYVSAQIRTNRPLDIPLPVCSSVVRDDSLDYPLLVPTNSYVYTANGCVRCKCDAAYYNWTLQCEPSHLKPTNWSTCPSMQCNISSNMYIIGSTTHSGSHNVTFCAYAGYGNQTIFTTLATGVTLPDNSDRVHSGKEGRWWIWLVVVAVIAIPILFYLCNLIWKKYKTKVDRKRKQKKLIWEIGGGTIASTLYNKAKGNTKDGKTNHEMRIFSFESIVAATNEFSIANKLGEGGFGPVYKGKLGDGQEIAVKRLASRSGQGLVEFKNEAKLIARLQHTNLVRLLGFCVQNEERILIYEYMPKKSLDFYLFDSNKRKRLIWERRFNIIQGITQGLVYLHHFSRLKVIHRDLKASNILLDYEMNPKISDFGMARIFELKGIEENTKRIVGTYGYMSPEYAMNGVVSVKIDVFSFGVLVLEILSGKKNNACYDSERPLNLIGLAWKLWNENRGMEIVDSLLVESCDSAQVLRCIQVGLLCVQDRATDRPTILEVVSMLSNETMLLPAPKQPAFYIDNVSDEGNRSAEVQQQPCSINKLTISVMDAR